MEKQRCGGNFFSLLKKRDQFCEKMSGVQRLFKATEDPFNGPDLHSGQFNKTQKTATIRTDSFSKNL